MIDKTKKFVDIIKRFDKGIEIFEDEIGSDFHPIKLRIKRTKSQYREGEYDYYINGKDLFKLLDVEKEIDDNEFFDMQGTAMEIYISKNRKNRFKRDLLDCIGKNIDGLCVDTYKICLYNEMLK